MDEATADLVLETPPEAAIIGQLREQAKASGSAVIATFEIGPKEVYYLVVSDRGTCVLLNDGITVETFNRDLDDDNVADALRAEA
jgi:hypothetical protein